MIWSFMHFGLHARYCQLPCWKCRLGVYVVQSVYGSTFERRLSCTPRHAPSARGAARAGQEPAGAAECANRALPFEADQDGHDQGAAAAQGRPHRVLPAGAHPDARVPARGPLLPARPQTAAMLPVKRQRHSDRPISKWSRSDRPQCHRLVKRAPHQWWKHRQHRPAGAFSPPCQACRRSAQLRQPGPSTQSAPCCCPAVCPGALGSWGVWVRPRVTFAGTALTLQCACVRARGCTACWAAQAGVCWAARARACARERLGQGLGQRLGWRRCTRRRLLQSPDIQLFATGRANCDCDSGLARMKCCHRGVAEADGGVIWPHYHECPCRWPFDPVLRPKARAPSCRSGCSRGQAAQSLASSSLHIVLLLSCQSMHVRLSCMPWSCLSQTVASCLVGSHPRYSE